MSNLGIAGLVMAYVVLATFLLSLHLYTNWTWWPKVGATLAVAIFYFVTYAALPQTLGWPTSKGLPENFQLVAFNVNDDQSIYIWAREIKNGSTNPRPRAFVLAYTEALHEKVEKAGRQLRTGRTIIGRVNEMSDGPLPRNAPSLNRIREELNVTFQDAPTTGNFRKE